MAKQLNELEQMQSLNLPQGDLENYDHIELSLEEVEEALRLLREQKHWQQERVKYAQRVINPPAYPKFTADEMLEAYIKEYTLDDENRETIEQIAYYFADDSRFLGNLKKGLLIYGTVGVGKTSLLKFFHRNQKQSYIVVSCRDIEKGFASHKAEDSDDGIGKYSLEWLSKGGDQFGHKVLGFCFDDLGTEPLTTKYFGTDKAVMTEVILNRYDNQLPFAQTHITTNLSAEDIQRYGSRVVDRMREMFNFIEFKSTKSRRV